MAVTTNNPINDRRSERAAVAGRIKDTFAGWFIRINGQIAILAIALIFVFLLKDSMPLFKDVTPWKFVSGRAWQPEFGVFGLLPLLAGSFVVTVGAVLFGVPVGVACAVYLAEVAPKWVREIVKPVIEVLAGIPSVVIGFIGLMIAAPVIQSLLNLPIGVTGLAGSVMLGFMALPTIVSMSEDAITAVPKSHRDGSLALGASRWETISRVVVPAARSGIIAACMLGVGRAVGETMTVLMVTGNAPALPNGLSGLGSYLLGPVRTMTATIALEMGDCVQYSSHYHALFAVGLALFGITFAINLTADLILRKRKR